MQIKKFLAPALAGVMLITGLVGGCKQAPALVAPPYIPAEYYNCVESYPTELIHAYFAGYGEIWGPMQKYNDKVFVFKDNIIDAWMVRELDKGWLWLDLIKCPIVNIEDMQKYKIGDKIDVVGLNLGPEDIKTPGLTFKDCYVLPCGSINLPADGTGGAVGPGY
jgi:hypothetical protein